MAEITAALVKDLREKTGAGMMDCKKALMENGGDIEVAIDWLRKKGLAAAAKKSGRVAAEGLIGVASTSNAAAMIEINAETDFVARNETFQAFVHTARSVIDVRGQRVDGRDRLYLATDLPLLVVWGGKDAIIPVQHGLGVAESVPTARLEVFAQSGHFPHLTEPKRLSALLHDWISTTEPAQLDAHSLTQRLRQPVA